MKTEIPTLDVAEWTPRLRNGTPASDSATGVLLMNMGGPDRIESIRPFLQNLFSDRQIIRFPMPAWSQMILARVIAKTRAPKVAPGYEMMGGCSPQLTYTFMQAEALEDALQRRGTPARVYVGMRYWKPFVDEAIARMEKDGIRRVVVLPLYPQYSRATTGSSVAALDEAVRTSSSRIEFLVRHSWETYPPYIDALAETVREGIDTVMSRGTERPAILFSAHSLPVRFIEEGDPYLDQIRRTVAAVVERLEWEGDWRLAFQSRTGPVRWLTPSTPDALRAIAAEGHHRVVVVPVSFVSDHIETLEELDVQYGDLARTFGIAEYVRTPGLNVRPRFIDALASLVTEQLAERGTVQG